MSRPLALGDDIGHLVHLSLRAAECPESLLRQLSRTLILAVPEKFDDAAFVRCESSVPFESTSVRRGEESLLLNVPRDLPHDLPHEGSPFAQMAFHARDTRLRLAWSQFLQDIVC